MKKQALALVAAASAVVMMLSGCGASNNASNNAASDGKMIITAGDSEPQNPLVPGNTNETAGGVVIDLVFSRLVSFDDKGNAKNEVAESITPNENATQYTIKLKSGWKFTDGTPVTSESFTKAWSYVANAKNAQKGSSFFSTIKGFDALQKADSLKGDEQLEGLKVVDDSTFTVDMNQPDATFPIKVGYSAFSPLPESFYKDTKAFGEKPVSNGPYKVESNEAGKQAVFVRNTYWDKKTDPVRTAGPDKIVFKMGQDTSVAAQSIMQGTGEGKNSFLSGFVPAAQLAQAQANPNYKKLLTTSGDGALEYLAINTQHMKNAKIRQALQYAVDKKAYQTASGGEIAGNFATTLITPGIEGREDYDLYKADPTGDVDKAKQLIKESGEQAPTLKLIATSAQAETASSIQTSLKRAGVKVDIQTLNDDVYSDTLTNDKGDYDLAISSWQPDFPSPYANISPLFDSSQIGNGNYNLARYANPKVDALIKKATETIDQTEAGKIWAEADKTIMADAPVVPLIYSKNTFIHGSNVTNFVIGNFPAYPDYTQVSLASAN